MVTEITVIEPEHTYVRRYDPKQPQWRGRLAMQWTEEEWLGEDGRLGQGAAGSESGAHPLSVLLPRIAGAGSENAFQDQDGTISRSSVMLETTRKMTDLGVQQRCL
jgi:hypothetical protein